MTVIWTPNGICQRCSYESEANLEQSMLRLRRQKTLTRFGDWQHHLLIVEITAEALAPHAPEVTYSSHSPLHKHCGQHLRVVGGRLHTFVIRESHA